MSSITTLPSNISCPWVFRFFSWKSQSAFPQQHKLLAGRNTYPQCYFWLSVEGDSACCVESSTIFRLLSVTDQVLLLKGSLNYNSIQTRVFYFIYNKAQPPLYCSLTATARVTLQSTQGGCPQPCDEAHTQAGPLAIPSTRRRATSSWGRGGSSLRPVPELFGPGELSRTVLSRVSQRQGHIWKQPAVRADHG